MDSSSVLLDLLARVEKATGPDRELDEAIAWIALGEDWSMHTRAVNEPFPHVQELPPYTASLDAALALVERVLPGWGWSLDRDRKGQYSAESENGVAVFDTPNRPTAALAILDALLQALSASAPLRSDASDEGPGT